MSRFNNTIITSFNWKPGDIIKRTWQNYNRVKKDKEYILKEISPGLLRVKKYAGLYDPDGFEFIRRPNE